MLALVYRKYCSGNVGGLEIGELTLDIFVVNKSAICTIIADTIADTIGSLVTNDAFASTVRFSTHGVRLLVTNGATIFTMAAISRGPALPVSAEASPVSAAAALPRIGNEEILVPRRAGDVGFVMWASAADSHAAIEIEIVTRLGGARQSIALASACLTGRTPGIEIVTRLGGARQNIALTSDT